MIDLALVIGYVILCLGVFALTLLYWTVASAIWKILESASRLLVIQDTSHE